MLSKNRWVCALMILLAALAAGGCKKTGGLKVGDTLEPVVLSDIAGRAMNLPGDVKGKVALVRFWSIECPSCSKESMAALETLYQKYRDKGFVVVTVNVHQTAQTAEHFRALQGISYPLLMDPNAKVAARFGVAALPTTLILDAKGVVREKVVGDAGIDVFEKLITQILYKGDFYDAGV